VSPKAISTSILLFQEKWDCHKSVHAHANMILTLHHFYVILQVAGLGYLIGGSVIVAEPPTTQVFIPPGSGLFLVKAAGKLNFWLLCNKGASLTALRHAVLGVQLNSFSN